MPCEETPVGGDAQAPMLELRGVSAAYGPIEVLHDVDLTIPAGSIVGLLGPNGAGKSTTIKVASGLLKATGGCLHVRGRHVNGIRPEVLARSGIRTIPEARGLFPNLTVRENLKMASYATKRSVNIEQRAYADFPWLRDRRNQLAGTLSGGEQRTLAMVRVITADPAVLLLDELSMGLAPRVLTQLYDQVAKMAESGISVLVVEQFAQAVLDIADHVIVMVQGRVVAAGRPADVVDALPDAYLGAGA